MLSAFIIEVAIQTDLYRFAALRAVCVPIDGFSVGQLMAAEVAVRHMHIVSVPPKKKQPEFYGKQMFRTGEEKSG